MRLAPCSRGWIAPIAIGALAFAGCGSGTTNATSAAKITTDQHVDTGATKETSKQPRSLVPTRSPSEGAKAVGPGVPAAKGGDNSIQTFGAESESTDRVQAGASAKAYLDARLAGRWAAACSALTAPVREQIEAFAEQPHASPAKRCVVGMRGLTEPVSKAVLRIAAKIRVLSFRVQGNRAFLLYKDGEGTASELPMLRQNGQWKVAAVAGSALVL